MWQCPCFIEYKCCAQTNAPNSSKKSMLHINIISLLLLLPKPRIKPGYDMGIILHKYGDITISQNLVWYIIGTVTKIYKNILYKWKNIDKEREFDVFFVIHNYEGHNSEIDI